MFSKGPIYDSSFNINVISRYVVMRLQITTVNGNEFVKIFITCFKEYIKIF